MKESLPKLHRIRLLAEMGGTLDTSGRTSSIWCKSPDAQRYVGQYRQSGKSRIYSSWIEERERHFIGLLDVNPQAKCIDLGCGGGEFTSRVRAAIRCDKIYGIDTWKEGLDKAKRVGVDTVAMDLDMPLGISSGTFDVATANQVIEHLNSPEIFVSETYRILKPGAYAVISTENLSSWDNLAALAVGITPFSVQFKGVGVDNPFSAHAGERVPEDYPIHTRIFTFFGLRNFVASFGFRIEKTVGSGHLIPFGSHVDRWHTRFITVKARKPRQKPLPKV